MLLNLDQYAVDLYRNSRRAFERGDLVAAHEFYRRNRAENGFEAFYEVELPERLRLIHPIGCVLGRAEYRGALVAYQGSGVGSDLDGNKPVLGDGVVLFPGARVLGSSVIGDNVFITANTVVQNVNIPSNSIVYSGYMPKGHASSDVSWDSYMCPRWKRTTRSVISHFFP